MSNKHPIQVVPQDEAALSHGVYRWLGRALAPPCSRCIAKEKCDLYQKDGTCRLAEQHKAEILKQLMALPHILPTDRPLVVEYSQLVVALRILDFWVSEVGPFLPKGGLVLDVQPALKLRQALSNSMVRLASELGLSPAGRHRLKTSAEGPASALARTMYELDDAEREAD